MRRVVITGLGIVSCLGNDKETVSANLREVALASGSTRNMPKWVCVARFPAPLTFPSKS